MKTKLGNGINKYNLSTKPMFFILPISMFLTAPLKMQLPNFTNIVKTKKRVSTASKQHQGPTEKSYSLTVYMKYILTKNNKCSILYKAFKKNADLGGELGIKLSANV